MKRLRREFNNVFDLLAIEPTLRVRLGEEFVVETETSMSGRITSEADLPVAEILEDLLTEKRFNPCGGPIFIEDVDPGDTLVVEVVDIVVSDVGYILIGPGAGPFADSAKYSECGKPHTKFIRHLPGNSGTTSDGTGVFNDTITWRLAPMIGTICTVPLRPVAANADSVFMQCEHGGNLDCRDIRRGARVLLPAAHTGGLLYLGDVHSSQATEFGSTGVESRAEVSLRCHVRKNRRIPWVRVELDDRIIQLNSYRPIDQGLTQAYIWMIDWLVADYGFSARDAVMQMGGNPDVGTYVYQMSIGGRLNHTVGVSFPTAHLGRARPE